MAMEKGINIIDFDDLDEEEKLDFDSEVQYEYKTKYGKLYFYKRRTPEEVKAAVREFEKKKEAERLKIEKEKQKKEQRKRDIRNVRDIEITEEEYRNLPSDLKNGYEWIYHQSGPQRDPTITYTKGRSLAEIEQAKQDRLNVIRNTNNIEITEEEYRNLPSDLKNGYEWKRQYAGPQWDPTYTYIKGRSNAQIERDQSNYLRRVETDPNIELSDKDYKALPANIRNRIRWVSFQKGAQWDLETYWRKETPADVKREKINILENRKRELERRAKTKQSVLYSEPIDIRDNWQVTTYYFTPEDYDEYQRIEEELRRLR